jgi:type IV pilus assembly protein PilX
MRRPFNQKTNTGVALFISLVLLLVLTILGVSVVQTTSLEIRMARNEHDNLLAFEAAESALRDAEAALVVTTSTFAYNDGGVGGLWDIPEVSDLNRWDDDAIWSDGRTIIAASVVNAVPSQPQPRYMIEHIATVQRDENAYQQDNEYNTAGSSDSVDVFRVTALGFGGSPNSRAMLQTTFGRILD